MCEQCKLQDRVQFLGKLAHENVRDVSWGSASPWAPVRGGGGGEGRAKKELVAAETGHK